MCIGRGARQDAIQTCTSCRGTGVRVQLQQLLPGFVQQIQTQCSDCLGQGERYNTKDRCSVCQGRKIIRERKILDVHVDPGLLLLS